MADTNKDTLIEKLTDIADGFRTSRSLTETLSLEDMAVLAAVPIGSGENKFTQLVNKTITEVTAEDLEGVVEIGINAFYNCSNLMSVTIPDSVTSIGNSAFYYCTGLTSVTIPDSVTSIGNSAFYYCNSLTSITIPDSVTSIGNSAFYNCSNLMSVTIPDSVTSIGDSAFYDCSNLMSVTIGNGVTSLGKSAFSSCDSLTSITIGDGVTSIENYTFNGCKNLTSITIPSSVRNINAGALLIGSQTNKAIITFLSTTPPTIKTGVFATNYLEKIIVPKGCGEAYKSATNWANVADFIEEASV